MGTIVGIDLGTTFSAVAQLDDVGRPVIVYNEDGLNITPSVLTFEGEAKIFVGESARKQLEEPNTVGRFKREMGTQQVYKTLGGEYTPRQLSTIVLKKLKEETEKKTGPISEAVVTIPANFSNEAREDTLAAAKAAGLNVKYIINEPTAAAMYFAQSSGKDLGGVYAVFDLGGGTFDVTIMRINGKDIDVLATEGVSKLGGDDFDKKIREIVAKKYEAEKGGTVTKDDFTLNDAEDIKKALSTKDDHRARTFGSAGRADVSVSRGEFEESISTHIAQIEMLCETAIEEAGISIGEIEEVILAGGSTRIPAVQKSVERVFGKKPISFGNPDEIVALGAAVYAALKADPGNLNPLQRNAVAGVKISEVASKYFGTISVGLNQAKQSEELQNSIVIEKGTKIPCSVTKTFYTISEGQTAVNCTVTEGNTPETDPRFVRVVWKGELGPLPSGRPENQPVEVTFAYTENQVMECSFLDVESGKRAMVELSQGSHGGDQFDIEKFVVE